MDVEVVSVGDELLRGETVNTNAAWLGRQLDARGVDVARVTVIPDDVSVIAGVVSASRERADAVLVTGGLGPTHDDRTMEGVARAVGVRVEPHPGARSWLAAETDYELDALAPGTIDLPVGSRYLPNEVGVAPGCVLDGIYVLPGVPAEMEAMFDLVADEFVGEVRHATVVEVAQPEREIAATLSELEGRFDVTVGSYPGETVRVRLRSADHRELKAAERWLRERVEVAQRSK
ncbi:MAG: competence/damage-inducible protein A [Halobacteriota archaeon]